MRRENNSLVPEVDLIELEGNVHKKLPSFWMKQKLQIRGWFPRQNPQKIILLCAAAVRSPFSPYFLIWRQWSIYWKVRLTIFRCATVLQHWTIPSKVVLGFHGDQRLAPLSSKAPHKLQLLAIIMLRVLTCQEENRQIIRNGFLAAGRLKH